MHRLKKAKITLNVYRKMPIRPINSQIPRANIYVVNQDGIQPDPEKVRAVTAMPPPTNVPEVRRFMGMVNQLSPNLQTK